MVGVERSPNQDPPPNQDSPHGSDATGSDATSWAKDAMRRELRARRRSITERVGRCTRITEAVLALQVLHEASVVHCYLATPWEVQTHSIVLELLRRGTEVLCPIVPAVRPEIGHQGGPREGLEQDELSAQSLTVADAVWPTVGPRGIPAPRHPRPITADDMPRVDVCLVPLLAFDSSLHRLGNGAGHYDRQLARWAANGWSPYTIGLAFGAQRVDRVPTESHDMALRLVVTEHELVRSR